MMIIDDNLSIYNAYRSVPENAQKPIMGGRVKGMIDISPMWRIKVLTQQFGPCGIGWYYKSVRKWTEVHGEEIAAFVDIELYIKVNDEWSMPISGTGGNMFCKKENNGMYVSDECYKMATTDAISVACKQLGIGADIYWDADRTKYTTQVESAPPITADIKKRFAEVEKELKRIGYTPSAVCKTYKIEQIYDMSDLQIKDFLAKAKRMPDKEAG